MKGARLRDHLQSDECAGPESILDGRGDAADQRALKVRGSGPSLCPVSRRDICSIWASSRAKSKTSKFSRMRDGVTDFGMTMLPSWMCQRSTTCAGDLFLDLATSASTGSANSPLPCPN